MSSGKASEKEEAGFILFSAKEVAITAAFAGLQLAGVLLGLIIPVLPGGGALWALQPLMTPAAYAAGPIAGVLIVGIAGTVRPVALENWIVFGAMYAFIGATYYPFKDWSLKKKIPVLFALDAFAWGVLAAFGTTWMDIYVYHFAPQEAFWEYFYLTQTLFTLPSVIMDWIAIAIVLTLFPNFAKPTWWDRWKKSRK